MSKIRKVINDIVSEKPKIDRLSSNWKKPHNASKFLECWLAVSKKSEKDTIYVRDLWDACEAEGIYVEASRGVNAGNGKPVSAAAINGSKAGLIALFVDAGRLRGADEALMKKWETTMMVELKTAIDEPNLGVLVVDNDFFKKML